MGNNLTTEQEVRFHLRQLKKEIDRIEKETRSYPHAQDELQSLRKKVRELEDASEAVMARNEDLCEELRQQKNRMKSLEADLELLQQRLEDQEHKLREDRARMQQELQDLAEMIGGSQT